MSPGEEREAAENANAKRTVEQPEAVGCGDAVRESVKEPRMQETVRMASTADGDGICRHGLLGGRNWDGAMGYHEQGV
jgi:hypothetical protein